MRKEEEKVGKGTAIQSSLQAPARGKNSVREEKATGSIGNRAASSAPVKQASDCSSD